MFAYCRNNPVCRKDATGTDDVSATDFNSDNNHANDLGGAVRPGNGRGGGSGVPGKSVGSGHNGANGEITGYEYSTPPGGGGITSSIQVGNTTVTFGHGGRHMDFNDISGLESTIANDVVTRPPTTGNSLPILISYGGADFTYRYFTLSDTRINVEKYYYTNNK